MHVDVHVNMDVHVHIAQEAAMVRGIRDRAGSVIPQRHKTATVGWQRPLETGLAAQAAVSPAIQMVRAWGWGYVEGMCMAWRVCGGEEHGVGGMWRVCAWGWGHVEGMCMALRVCGGEEYRVTEVLTIRAQDAHRHAHDASIRIA